MARWTLAGYWLLIFVGTHWPDVARFKRGPDWPFVGFGVVVHAVMYGGWAALWCWVLWSAARRPPRFEELEKVWTLGVVYAAFDELTQLLVGRTGKVSDAMVDVAAVTLVFAAVLLAARRPRRAGDKIR